MLPTVHPSVLHPALFFCIDSAPFLSHFFPFACLIFFFYNATSTLFWSLNWDWFGHSSPVRRFDIEVSGVLPLTPQCEVGVPKLHDEITNWYSVFFRLLRIFNGIPVLDLWQHMAIQTVWIGPPPLLFNVETAIGLQLIYCVPVQTQKLIITQCVFRYLIYTPQQCQPWTLVSWVQVDLLSLFDESPCSQVFHQRVLATLIAERMIIRYWIWTNWQILIISTVHAILKGLLLTFFLSTAHTWLT